VTGYPVGDRQTWRRLDVSGGQPQVYAATTEEFVAQMLNLDVLHAIAFDKGCYTGQEVIARAHYRGRVKRRMQRFVSREPCHLAPGDSGQLADGRAFKVVLATQLADGRCDFLAVAPLVGAGRDEAAATAVASPNAAATPAPAPTVGATQAVHPAAASPNTAAATPALAPTVAGATQAVHTAAAPTAATVLVAEQAPLPYSLPD
jgi:folate-binding protein YgfZ